MPRPSRKEEVFTVLPAAEVAAWTKTKRGALGTVADLCRRVGITHGTTAQFYLNRLHEDGRAYIGTWNRTRKAPAAVWVKGAGEHAPRPEPLPKKITRARYEKNKATAIERARAGKTYDQRYSHHVGAALATDTVRRSSVAPVNWLSALGL